MSDLLVAIDSFRTAGGRMVLAGQTVAADDPDIVGRERFFVDADAATNRNMPVEAATARPGEQRATVRPKKATAKKD